MLDYLLLFFAGKAFYELAAKHNKNRWGYGILGAVILYISAFIGGIFIVIIQEYNEWTITDVTFTIISFVLGAPICYLIYRLLQRKFERALILKSQDLLDSDF